MALIRNALSKIPTPLIFLFIILLFIIGFIGVLVSINLLVIYSDVALNLVYIAPIIFLLVPYYKYRKSMLSETLWKVESRYIFISGITLSILVTFNYWRGFVTAPIILFICGIYGISITYMVSREGLDSAQRNTSDLSYKIKPPSSKIPQQVIGNLIILVIVSGYWFIQIQKNEQATKNEGIEQALDLANYVVYLNPPSQVAIRVDSIGRIVFTKVNATERPGKEFQMCIAFTLEESRNGLYFEKLPVSEEICFSEDRWYSGWSTYEMENEVRNLVSKKFQ
jgi:hypothetical protein